MDFDLSNGSGKINIFEGDVGRYIQYEETPLAVVWPNTDWEDGSSFYLSNLSQTKDYRKQVAESLDFDLSVDYSNDLPLLFQKLEPLIRLLENGSYQLSVSNHRKNIQIRTSNAWAEEDQLGHPHWGLEAAISPTINSNTPKTWYEDGRLLKTMVDRSSHHFEDDGELHFISTIPFFNRDLEKVRDYEDEIDEGERPAAILLQCFDFDGESVFYVLDGHCKLSVYLNLDIAPHLIVITQKRRTNPVNKSFEIGKFIDVLYPWQVRYIIKNGGAYGLEGGVSLVNSGVHRFIKNGMHSFFYPSGKIRHKAFYVNDKIDGVARDWYENGKLKKKWVYTKGRLTGKCKDYNSRGELVRIHSYGEKGEYLGSEQKRVPEGIVPDSNLFLFDNPTLGRKENWKRGLKIAVQIILTILVAMIFISRIFGK